MKYLRLSGQDKTDGVAIVRQISSLVSAKSKNEHPIDHPCSVTRGNFVSGTLSQLARRRGYYRGILGGFA
jgi:hypothetical protein